MTLAEILKANGLDDAHVKAVTDAMRESKIFTAAEENLDVRYGKLKAEHDALSAKHTESETLIADLQKATKGNEAVQAKVKEYEVKIAQKDAELEQVKLDAAIKVGLLAEKALDVDYLTFKLKEKGELAIDENGKIKGWDDKLAALKVQMPTQFEGSGKKTYQEHKLPDDSNGGGTGVTKEAFAKMGYQERLKL